MRAEVRFEIEMDVLAIDGVRIAALAACLPKREVDNLADCERFFGAKSASVVDTLGIRSRRIADAGVTSADLCIRAAEEVLKDADKGKIGAVVACTFTPAQALPGNAFAAQARLGLAKDTLAIDLQHACAGYPYALYMAALVAKNTGKNVLVLDGDVQSRAIDPNDRDTVPVLADAGTATIVEAAGGDEWRFAFMTDGERRDVLQVKDGVLRMDGFGVFRFVASDVARFLKDFMAQCSQKHVAFVPHQANGYMVRALAKALDLEKELVTAGERFGNSSSSTIPVALAANEVAQGRVLLSGFGAGLAASVASLPWHDAKVAMLDYDT
ncbi:MAG: hypothetical protein IJ802_06495 [Kiritimatiellae bacterium]|nr:hypothetical protein [Kiritimatiellia bacterium]